MVTQKRSISKVLIVVMALVMAFTFSIGQMSIVYADTANEAKVLADNIAKAYANNDEITKDGNYFWAVADMAAYEKTYPNTANIFSTTQKQAIVNALIQKINSATSPGDLSKCIIAFAALGYDASNITLEDQTTLDGAAKLTALINQETVPNNVKSAYTIGYEIIALQQFGEKYQDEIQKLVTLALEGKEGWQGLTWGPDAMAPVLLALAPYKNTNQKVKTVIFESESILSEYTGVNDNGAVGTATMPSAESTGLLIAGLKAIGENPSELYVGKDLVEGLLTAKSANNAGFNYNGNYNAMSTEQGFRGLVAALNKDGFRVYDFSKTTLKPVSTTCVQKDDNTWAKAKTKVLSGKVKVIKKKTTLVLNTKSKAYVAKMKKLGYAVKYQYTKKATKYQVAVKVYLNNKLLAKKVIK